MTAKNRIAHRVKLLGICIFSVGMLLSTLVYVISPTSLRLVDALYGIPLGVALLLICVSGYMDTEQNVKMRLAYKMFSVFAFLNLGNEVTFTAFEISVGEFWIGLGVLFYFGVLFNEAIIKKK